MAKVRGGIESVPAPGRRDGRRGNGGIGGGADRRVGATNDPGSDGWMNATGDPWLSRRGFLAASASCASYLAAAGPLLPVPALRRWGAPGRGRVVAQEPFARIEELGFGMYAIVSTPLNGDYATVCNGGIIGGLTGTLVVEAFATHEGAEWAARMARELTGGWPTHVVVTHYHADHSAGAAGLGRGDGAPPPLHARFRRIWGNGCSSIPRTTRGRSRRGSGSLRGIWNRAAVGDRSVSLLRAAGDFGHHGLADGVNGAIYRRIVNLQVRVANQGD